MNVNNLMPESLPLNFDVRINHCFMHKFERFCKICNYSCEGEEIVDLTSETPETSVVDLTNADCVVVGFSNNIANASQPSLDI